MQFINFNSKKIKSFTKYSVLLLNFYIEHTTYSYVNELLYKTHLKEPWTHIQKYKKNKYRCKDGTKKKLFKK